MYCSACWSISCLQHGDNARSGKESCHCRMSLCCQECPLQLASSSGRPQHTSRATPVQLPAARREHRRPHALPASHPTCLCSYAGAPTWLPAMHADVPCFALHLSGKPWRMHVCPRQAAASCRIETSAKPSCELGPAASLCNSRCWPLSCCEATGSDWAHAGITWPRTGRPGSWRCRWTCPMRWIWRG